MTQRLSGNNATTRMMHVKRACGCEADVHCKGPREARFYTKWLADQKCRQCEQEKK